MALPTSVSSAAGATLAAYAFSVGPHTAYVVAQMSDGTSQRVTPVVAYGRRYVAFTIRANAQKVAGLILYDRAGHVLASTAPPPFYWWVQFRP